MSVYSTTILQDSPLAYYRLGESSGPNINDSSGNGYTATASASGLTYSQAGALSGDANTAILFNGSSGKITCPGGVSSVGSGALSVEAWIKLSSNSFGQNATIWASGTTPSHGDGFKFWIGPNGANGGFAVGVYGDQWSQATFSQTFTAGTWYHVVGTWDGSTITCYVNGIQNGSTASRGGTTDSTGQSITIGQDPQSGSDYFPGTMQEAAIYLRTLSSARISNHYAVGTARLASPQALITSTPGNVLLLINDVWYPTIRQENIRIDRTASDPIPTFSFALQDDPSHIPLTELMELVFIDAGQIANPSHNLLSNPSMNPYTSSWTYTSHAGVTPSQNTGGGLILTYSNMTSGSQVILSQTTQSGNVVAGQSYMFSVQVQGGSIPTNISATLQLNLLDQSGTLVTSVSFAGPTPVSTTLTQYTLSVLVPSGIYAIQAQLIGTCNNNTNSGTITFTQAQLEPMSFTSGFNRLNYPTPWVDASQTNCILLPDGTCVRQLRLFGGYITKATAGSYVGNNRQWTVTCSGYAWLLQKQILNDSWTAQTDSTIITAIVSKYFLTTFSTSQVATSSQYSNTIAYTYNGTARDAFDTLAANSNYMWYIDAYRIIWYQPPGYNTLSFMLSDRPDNITSFPYYNYSRDFDATQLANAIYVNGKTGISFMEYDAQSIAIYNQRMSNNGTFWRTVNDSSLTSTAAAQSRAIGEGLQYNYARPILHLDTNQFMIPGYTVLFTSSTDGIQLASYLVQRAALILHGFLSINMATYECQCDLGAFNPDLTNILSTMKRTINANNGAPGPAYYGPIPAPSPSIGVMASEQMGYRDQVTVTITSSTPIGGIPTTTYGAAAATYGNPNVGYG